MLKESSTSPTVQLTFYFTVINIRVIHWLIRFSYNIQNSFHGAKSWKCCMLKNRMAIFARIPSEIFLVCLEHKVLIKSGEYLKEQARICQLHQNMDTINSAPDKMAAELMIPNKQAPDKMTPVTSTHNKQAPHITTPHKRVPVIRTSNKRAPVNTAPGKMDHLI